MNILLLDKNIKVNITARNITFYQNKGYNIPKKYRGEWEVRQEDVPLKGRVLLEFECDECGEHFFRYAYNPANHFDEGIYVITYCPKCYHKRTRDTMKKLYGVEYAGQVPWFKEKVRETSIAKYGVEHYRQSKEVQKKQRETVMKKYGVVSVAQLPENREKSKKLFYNNGLVSASAQQKHICNLVNGKLNYKFCGYYLDILFEDWLDIEYDGSGHNLRVQMGKMSQEKFDKNERKRFAVIHSNGLKTMVIKGNSQDILPSDEKLLIDIYKGIEYLKETSKNSYIIDYSNYKQ